MFGSEILDVAVGLIFVYILVAIICSAIREGIEAWMKTRAVYLEHGIRELLHDKNGEGLARAVFEHPLVFGLFSGDRYEPGANTTRPSMMTRGKNRPSYIPSRNFAIALLDIAARGPQGDATTASRGGVVSLETIRRNVANIPNAAVQRVVLTAVDSAQGDLDKAQAAIQDWYDSGMDRISGWYKRSTQTAIFIIGLVLAVGMNIDTMAVVHHLYINEASREAAVAAADNATPNQSYAAAKEELKKLKLPIGWTYATPSLTPPKWNRLWEELVGPWLGWLLTAFAATLGAPFWFDILNKVMVIRSTVKPREKSQEEGSEDRQQRRTVVRQPVARSGGGAAVPPPPSPPITGAADAETDVDACDLDFSDVPPTSDDQLPPAEGGVA